MLRGIEAAQPAQISTTICTEASQRDSLLVVQLHDMVLQGLQLLVVLVVADADDGHARSLDGGDQLPHPSSVTAAHAIHLIHDQAYLQPISLPSANLITLITPMVSCTRPVRHRQATQQHEKSLWTAAAYSYFLTCC